MGVATREELQASLGALGVSQWAIAAVAAAVESGVVGALAQPKSLADLAAAARTHPAMAAALVDVLSALGLVRRSGEMVEAEPGLLAVASGPPLEFLKADLRGSLLQSADMVAAAREGRLGVGWHYSDPMILETQGIFSEAAFSQLSRHVFPMIEGLSDSLAKPGAVALDIGSGVGGTAIALCRAFPTLRVIGIDPAPDPMLIARAAVERAGLADRIELRQVGVEDLEAGPTFDFVWLPQVFLDDRTFTDSLPRIRSAMRPGGVLLSVATNMDQTGIVAAVGRLRSTLIGGAARSIDQVRAGIEAAGFVNATRIATPIDGIMRFAFGRQPA